MKRRILVWAFPFLLLIGGAAQFLSASASTPPQPVGGTCTGERTEPIENPCAWPNCSLMCVQSDPEKNRCDLCKTQEHPGISLTKCRHGFPIHMTSGPSNVGEKADDPYSKGTGYSAALSVGTAAVLENTGIWGNATDTPPAPSQVGMTFQIVSDTNPNTRPFRVTSFLAKVPSFAHSALAPNLTGENIISLDPAFSSGGDITISTGKLVGQINGLLRDSYYSEGSPAPVSIIFEGTMNQTGNMEVNVTSIYYN